MLCLHSFQKRKEAIKISSILLETSRYYFKDETAITNPVLTPHTESPDLPLSTSASTVLSDFKDELTTSTSKSRESLSPNHKTNEKLRKVWFCPELMPSTGRKLAVRFVSASLSHVASSLGSCTSIHPTEIKEPQTITRRQQDENERNVSF